MTENERIQQRELSSWALDQERESLRWAKPEASHRRGELTPEQAREIARRLRATTSVPRFFSVTCGVIGVGLLAATALGTRVTPGLIGAAVSLLVLAVIYRLIIIVRFGGVRSALRAGKVEPLHGVVTGAFAFHWRSRGLDILVSVDHRRYKMLVSSIRDCSLLARALQNLAAQKTPVIAYVLPKTRLIVAIEPEPVP